MNALSGDTSLFAEVDGNYGVYTLKELYELYNQGHKIKVPTLLNERGEKTWVEVEDIIRFGMQPLKRITLTSSQFFMEFSKDIIIPSFSDKFFYYGRKRRINFKFQLANNLKITQDHGHNDTLLLTTNIPLNIPEGDEKEWDYGFALGFFLAEGCLGYRERKNTKRSLETMTAFARKKGLSLEEYLNYMTEARRVVLTIGPSDFERGHVDIIQKLFKFTKPYKHKRDKGYKLYSPDLSFIHLIKDYIDGSTSHDKHVKNEVYNRSWKFLEGILDGFLAGDGYFFKEEDLFQVGITTNYRLYNDLIFFSKALGYDIHLHKGHFHKSPSSNNYCYQLRLSIFKTYHRHTAFGLVKEHIKSIEDAGLKEAFNLVLKPLYPENDTCSVFNHLFFTAFGFLVSDAVKVLDRSSLKSPLALPLLQK